MFLAALFIIAQNWKQPQCPSTSECIGKMWHIQMMEYYSAIKRNEVLIHAIPWMSFENILQSERSQTRETAYCTIPFIRNVQKRQIIYDITYM